MRCNIDYAPLWKRRLYLRRKQLPEAVLYRRHKRAMVSREALSGIGIPRLPSSGRNGGIKIVIFPSQQHRPARINDKR